MAENHRTTVVVQSSNDVSVVACIGVDIAHGMDTVEIVSAWVRVAIDMPILPRTIAYGTDLGAGVGPDEDANHARVSNVDVSILTSEEKFQIE